MGINEIFNEEIKMSKDINRKIAVLERIAADMKSDAENFEGKPFIGKIVGEYFGNQGAAIAALANIIRSYLEETKNNSGLTESLSSNQTPT